LQNQSIFDWPGYEKFILKNNCINATTTVPRLLTFPAPVILPPEEIEKITATAKEIFHQYK